MALDRAVWTFEFTRASRLPWNCPACDSARLAVREGTLHEGQTAVSVEAQEDPASEPEWIKGRFSSMLVCAHCNGQIALAGTYRVQDDRYLDPQYGETGDYTNYYRPVYFSDAPHIIRIPPETPEPVSEELRRSFQLFWSDPESCANRIRSCVEKLLTQQGIPRTNGRMAANVGKKRVFLNLHTRIQLFEAKNRPVAQALMAVKWIGNAGSHSSPVSASDVLDGYELMEFVMDKVYVKRDSRIGALTRSINRRKGPRSRRRGP